MGSDLERHAYRLKRYLYRVTEELHQWRGAPKDLAEFLGKLRVGDHLLRNLGHADEVLPLEILDEGMVGSNPLGGRFSRSPSNT